MIDMSSIITNEMEENSIQLVNIVESIAKTLNSPNSCRVLKNILLK